jgi:hypothetical protein
MSDGHQVILRVIGLLRLDQRAAFGYGCVRAKKAAVFFRNSFSIRSRRFSFLQLVHAGTLPGVSCCSGSG